MSKKVISTDNKIQRSELSSPLTVPSGGGYTEVDSGFNDDETWNERGFSSYSKNEVVVLIEVEGTMPAGTEIVLTPEYNTFGIGDTVTTTADETTDSIALVRIDNNAIRDSDFMKVKYRFIQGGASYDVTKVHIQVKKKDDVNGGGFSDPLTNNGDIIIRDSGVTTRLAIGSADQVLTVSSGIPSWENSAAGFTDPTTTRGDIIFKDATTTTTRLALGTSGQVLQSDGADLAYATLDASSISDFDTEVGNHVDVAANTSDRHTAVTLAASATSGGLTLSTQEIGFQVAATDANGYLSSTDWNTFDGKLDDPMTTRGDVMIRDASNNTERLAIGTANQVIQSDGTDVSWATLTASDVSDFDTEVANNSSVSANTDMRTTAISLNGFLDPDNDVTCTFTDLTRTLSITPTVTSFEYYCDGVKYTESTGDSIVIADTEGLHYVYYDGATLSETTTFSTILTESKAWIACVYWDATNSKQIIFSREYFHGPMMSGRTHSYLHWTVGFKLESGGELSDIVIGDGSLDSHAQLSNEATVAYDEDARFSFSSRASTANLPVYYRFGLDTSNIWRIDEDDSFPVIPTGTGRAAYNQLSGGSWLLTEVTDGDFVLAHVVTTNDTDRPYAVIMGQSEYSTLGLARDGAETEVNTLIVDGLPSLEMKFLGTVIFQTDDTYGNTPQSRVRDTATGADYIDLRGIVLGRAGVSGTVTEHNALASIQGGSVGESYHFTEAQHTDLTDSGDSTLHYHATDRARANHTGTQAASTIVDFDTEVEANTEVAANTSARHAAVTLAASATTGGLTLSTQEIGFQVATAGQNGYLSSTDFSTFDGKMTDPLTTDGDLIIRDTSTTRLAIGSEDQVLTVVSGMPAWAAASGGFSDPMTTRGDIIYRDATNTTTRLGVGTANQVLQTDGTDLAYATLTASDISDFQTTVSANTDVDANTTARHDAVTLAASATTGGLSLSTQEIGFQASSAIQNGYVTSTDWSTFNGKQDTITTGDLTEATSSVLTIVGGTDAIIGSGLTIEVDQADVANDGYLSSTDWSTFNSKSDYSDPLTTNGDIVIRSGGSTSRLAIGSADQVLTVSGGLPVWAASASGFSDPMTTRGDIIYRDATNTTTRLGAGTADQVLTSDGTDISWEDASGGGTPGGSDGHVQYNNGGSFGGEADHFWDDTNKRLGIGTATPANALHIRGSGDQAIRIESTSDQADIFCISDVAAYTRAGGFRVYNDGTDIGFMGVYADNSTTAGKLTLETRENGGSMHLRLTIDEDGDLQFNPLLRDSNFQVSTDDRSYGLWVDGGNDCVGIGTNTFGTSAVGSFAIALGTAPTTSPAGQISIYAKDSSVGATNATIGFRTEQAVESIGTFTGSHKLRIWINETEYWWELDAV